MNSLEAAQQLLIKRGHSDLAALLRRATVDFDESTTYGSYLFSTLTTAIISAPFEEYEKLRALSEEDKNQLLKVLLEIYPPGPHVMEICEVVFHLNSETLVNAISDNELLQEIDNQKALMISVSTGGPKIASVNQEYIKRRERIKSGLDERGLHDPNPYEDLWAWYGKWSGGDFPTYQSRRIFIAELYNPLIEIINSKVSNGKRIFEEPTGWPKVDRQVGEARRRLEQATVEEHFQGIGHICREILISLGETVYDPDRYPSIDGVRPSQTDAKRMLESFIAVELAGGPNEEARKHAKSALDFAVVLQHKRTATFRQAALCAEATASVVNLIAIISGRRDP